MKDAAMTIKIFHLFFWSCLGVCLCLGYAVTAQDPVNSHIRVVVDLVQLNVAVTDHSGNYVTGLRPSDFVVTEDGIPQKISTFAEGIGPTRYLADTPTIETTENALSGDARQTIREQDDAHAHLSAAELSSATAGASVFVLFDTSNYMYRGFVFAQDAITDFIRSLEGADRIASIPIVGICRELRG